MFALKNRFQAYPGLDISYSASESWRTYLSFNRAFRLPTFTELYYQSPTNRGNPGLLPESAWHAEVGSEFRKGGFSAKMMAFYRYAGQSIDWVRTDSETIWHTENLGQIRTSGIETGVVFSPPGQHGLFGIMERIDLGYRYYFQHHAVGYYHSQYILDYLKWKMTAGLVLRIGSHFRFSVHLVWQDRNGSYTSYDPDQNLTEIDYKPFMTLDVGLSYRVRWMNLVLEGSNIFNHEYFDLGSIPQPGAWYKAGVEINLGRKD
jgi:iron complex outermembrane receptor protein